MNLRRVPRSSLPIASTTSSLLRSRRGLYIITRDTHVPPHTPRVCRDLIRFVVSFSFLQFRGTNTPYSVEHDSKMSKIVHVVHKEYSATTVLPRSI